ncbi:hypothetical protein SAMN05192545_2905 [Maribacter dokdonensis]|uniref:Bacterial repeat domain-containing protein n=1 Tax=Maribacter dokdonensis TaxID=320912 RepID=A0ABY0UTN0_9FLAO|nr:hypothetical protein [Maribacter dokdonensis]SDT16001.1 hypothetical protein SAMN05192545_2905 [Maribacter dokdonensis]
MKKALLIFVMLLSVCVSAQIKVTREGYPKFENKQPTTTVAATDTLMISKVDGIQMGISFADFTNGLNGGTGAYLPLSGGEMQGAIDMGFSSIYDVSDISSISGNFDNIISNDLTPYDSDTWVGSKLVVNRGQFRTAFESNDFVKYREFAGGAVEAITFPKISSTNVQIGTSIGSGMFFDSNGNLQLFKHQDYLHKAAILEWENTSIRNYKFQDKSGTVAFLDDITGSGSIADNSVTSAKIANGTILNEDINDNTIEARKLLDATIVGSKLANGAVDSDRILNGTILEEDLSAAVQNKLNSSGSSDAEDITYDNTTSGLTATDVQGAIDEIITDQDNLQNGIDGNAVNISALEVRSDSIVSVLNTPTISLFDFDEKISSSTAILTDAQDNKRILLDYDDETYTIPSGVFSEGHAISIQSKGNGLVKIIPASGVSFSGWDGFQLDSLGKGITIARINSNVSPEEWFPISGYKKNYLENSNAGNLFTTAFYGNLFSPNSAVIPAGLQNTTGNITQESTTVFNGTTAMRYDYIDGAGDFAYFEFPTSTLSVGDIVTLTFKYYIESAGTARKVQLYDATTGFSTLDLNSTAGVWLDGSVTHTIGQITSGGNRVYLKGDSNFIVDNLKIIKN